jgi:hypothetical protein
MRLAISGWERLMFHVEHSDSLANGSFAPSVSEFRLGVPRGTLGWNIRMDREDSHRRRSSTPPSGASPGGLAQVKSARTAWRNGHQLPPSVCEVRLSVSRGRSGRIGETSV